MNVRKKQIYESVIVRMSDLLATQFGIYNDDVTRRYVHNIALDILEPMKDNILEALPVCNATNNPPEVVVANELRLSVYFMYREHNPHMYSDVMLFRMTPNGVFLRAYTWDDIFDSSEQLVKGCL